MRPDRTGDRHAAHGTSNGMNRARGRVESEDSVLTAKGLNGRQQLRLKTQMSYQRNRSACVCVWVCHVWMRVHIYDYAGRCVVFLYACCACAIGN